MKKTLLSAAVAAVAFGSVASAATVYDKDGTSLDIYGRVQSVLYSAHASGVGGYLDTSGTHHEYNSINTSGRLGINMRQKYNETISFIGNYEFDVANSESGSGFSARYLWVGLDMGKFGTVKVGRNEDAVKYVIGQTDIFDDWGASGQLGNDDKRDGLVLYTWSGSGFDVNASFQGAENNQPMDGLIATHGPVSVKANPSTGELEPVYGATNAEKAQTENAFALSVGYTSPNVLFGPISARLGYGITNFMPDTLVIMAGATTTTTTYASNSIVKQNLDISFENSSVAFDKVSHIAASLSWGSLSQGPYVAAMFTQKSFSTTGEIKGIVNNKGETTNQTARVINTDYDITGYEFAAGYGFANGVSVRTGYTYITIDPEDDAFISATAKTIPVYVNWNLTPNFNVWAEARFDAGSDDKGEWSAYGLGYDGCANNMYSAGMRYTF